MKISIAESPDLMAVLMADHIARHMEHKQLPLFCPASGDTPAALYRELCRRVRDSALDLSNWYFVGLDEWVGMNGEDEGSCRNSLDRLLFFPAGIAKEKICFFDGKANDLRGECLRTEKFIAERGVIDVAVLGIGINGHVAMNEPGSSTLIRSHVTSIHPTTAATGQKYFKSYRPLVRGITLGLADLLEARHIFLIASGEHKAPIVQKALEGPVSPELPASLLRDHPGLEVVLDTAAAKRLSGQAGQMANRADATR